MSFFLPVIDPKFFAESIEEIQFDEAEICALDNNCKKPDIEPVQWVHFIVSHRSFFILSFIQISPKLL